MQEKGQKTNLKNDKGRTGEVKRRWKADFIKQKRQKRVREEFVHTLKLISWSYGYVTSFEVYTYSSILGE